MLRLPITDNTLVMVLTGAGISAESGIPTFRGVGGYWNGLPVEKLATPEGFSENSDLVWEFYSHRRRTAETALPNPAHRALVELERSLGERFLLVTQNVDGLHLKAGSQKAIELHGNLFQTRCVKCSFKMRDPYPHIITPKCPHCSANLRPDIVWFGENLSTENMIATQRFFVQMAKGPSIFLAVGTSGFVQPAAAMVEIATSLGALTILVNDVPSDNVGKFDHYLEGKAGEVLPKITGY